MTTEATPRHQLAIHIADWILFVCGAVGTFWLLALPTSPDDAATRVCDFVVVRVPPAIPLCVGLSVSCLVGAWQSYSGAASRFGLPLLLRWLGSAYLLFVLVRVPQRHGEAKELCRVQDSRVIGALPPKKMAIIQEAAVSNDKASKDLAAGIVAEGEQQMRGALAGLQTELRASAARGEDPRTILQNEPAAADGDGVIDSLPPEVLASLNHPGGPRSGPSTPQRPPGVNGARCFDNLIALLPCAVLSAILSNLFATKGHDITEGDQRRIESVAFSIAAPAQDGAPPRITADDMAFESQPAAEALADIIGQMEAKGIVTPQRAQSARLAMERAREAAAALTEVAYNCYTALRKLENFPPEPAAALATGQGRCNEVAGTGPSLPLRELSCIVGLTQQKRPLLEKAEFEKVRKEWKLRPCEPLGAP